MKPYRRSRQRGIGGTDAAAVLGLDTYQSRFDVWLSKLGLASRGFRENQYTQWGKRKEPVVAQAFAQSRGLVLVRSAKRVHPKHDWWFGSPDRLIQASSGDPDAVLDPVSGRNLARVGLEIKTGMAKHGKRWGRSGTIIHTFDEAKANLPLNYYVQCCWYMEIMGFERWHLVVLLDSADYREFMIVRDPDFTSYMERTVSEFWNRYVATKTPPPIDDGKLIPAYLATRYPTPTEEIRDPTPGELALYEAVRPLRAEAALLLAEIKEQEEEHDRRLDNLNRLKRDLDKAEVAIRDLSNRFREQIGYDLGLKFPTGEVLKWHRGEKGHSLRWSGKGSLE